MKSHTTPGIAEELRAYITAAKPTAQQLIARAAQLQSKADDDTALARTLAGLEKRRKK